MTTPWPEVWVVFGTRPEALKMAPVVRALQDCGRLSVRVVVTGQHDTLLSQVLELFGIVPSVNLRVMRHAQDLTGITVEVLQGLNQLLQTSRPSLLLVHGDTTTAMSAALAAFYAKVPVAHVEAGLRTGDLAAPWPEEMNRVITARLTALHFAPTQSAREHLLQEGIASEQILVTGNTVIDALATVRTRLAEDAALCEEMAKRFDYLDAGKRLLLVTAHRRENFGEGLVSICSALQQLARREDVQVLYAVHPNPQVHEPVQRLLSGVPDVFLAPPLNYLEFVFLLTRSHLVLTDSGGVQEEAPGLGKPVLVLRDVTERPEAVLAGTAKLVGNRAEGIVSAANHLLDDATAYRAMAHARNPFGDGQAAPRIAAKVLEWLKA